MKKRLWELQGFSSCFFIMLNILFARLRLTIKSWERVIVISKTTNDIQLFQKIIAESGIDLRQIKDYVNDLPCNDYLEQHPYKIWQASDGKWKTYLQMQGGVRVQRVRQTREELEQLIIAHIRGEEYNPHVRLYELFQEWVDGKYNRQEISIGTYKRYIRSFQRLPRIYRDKRVEAITELDIEDMILTTIMRKHLTIKEYSNLRTVIYGVFKRAKKKQLINFSIRQTVADIDISRRVFRRPYKDGSGLVFSLDETRVIEEYIINKKDVDIVDYGILLLFKTGLRPGELASLQKDDIKQHSVIVRRTEVEAEDENKKLIHTVQEFPKTEAGNREVFVPDAYAWLLEKIRTHSRMGVYAFEVKGKRVQTGRFSARLETICNHLNIPPRSLNKIRKTYATALLNADVSERVILAQMGHTDLETTKRYYYKDNREEEQKRLEINGISTLVWGENR